MITAVALLLALIVWVLLDRGGKAGIETMRPVLEALEPRLLLSAPPTTPPQIIDDGDAAFVTEGTWTRATDGGFDGDYVQRAGDSTGSATWTFTGLTPGYEYQVSATWRADTDRASDVSYAVVDVVNGDVSYVLAAMEADQTVAPDDFDDSGALWENLGVPYVLRGTSLSVQLSGGLSGVVIADAIRVERMGQWVAPTGIPAPEFGIEQTHWTYVDPAYTYDYGSGLELYRMGADGPYTHYVDPTHADATDINNPFGTPDRPRVTAPTGTLPAGSIVEIHGGPYAAELTFLAHGTADNPVFFRGPSEGARPEFHNDINLKGHYLIVENIYQYGHEVEMKIRADGADTPHHVAVRHSEIAGDGQYASGGGQALSVRGSSDYKTHHIVIFDNHIHSHGDSESTDSDRNAAAVTSHTEDIWLVGNRMHHNQADSILLKGLDASLTKRIYIGYNHLHDDYENAIDIKEASDVIVSQNTMHGAEDLPNSDGKMVVVHENKDHGGPANVWFLYNEIYDAKLGIVVAECDGMYIVGNIIHDTYDRAVHFSYSQDMHVVGNTIYNTGGGIAYAWSGGSDIDIVNNILVDMTGGGEHIYIEKESAAAASVMQNNLLYQSGEAISIDWGGDYYDSIADFQAATGQGQGSLEADPLFVDPTTGDVRLQNTPTGTSPAIDAGADIQYYLDLFYDAYGLDIGVDLIGVSRPQGAGIDMGALECVAPKPGDFNGDGTVDAADIDILCNNVGGDPVIYDLDEDGDVDGDDQIFLVEQFVEWDDGVNSGVGTAHGDFNLDGRVDTTDLTLLATNYSGADRTWAQGNANGYLDDTIDTTDLTILAASFGFDAGAADQRAADAADVGGLLPPGGPDEVPTPIGDTVPLVADDTLSGGGGITARSSDVTSHVGETPALTFDMRHRGRPPSNGPAFRFGVLSDTDDEGLSLNLNGGARWGKAARVQRFVDRRRQRAGHIGRNRQTAVSRYDHDLGSLAPLGYADAPVLETGANRSG